jgi:hypothetical protein
VIGRLRLSNTVTHPFPGSAGRRAGACGGAVVACTRCLGADGLATARSRPLDSRLGHGAGGSHQDLRGDRLPGVREADRVVSFIHVVRTSLDLDRLPNRPRRVVGNRGQGLHAVEVDRVRGLLDMLEQRRRTLPLGFRKLI